MNRPSDWIISPAIISQFPVDYLIGIIIGMVLFGLWSCFLLRKDIKKVENLEEKVKEAAIELRLRQERLTSARNVAQHSEGSETQC